MTLCLTYDITSLHNSDWAWLLQQERPQAVVSLSHLKKCRAAPQVFEQKIGFFKATEKNVPNNQLVDMAHSTVSVLPQKQARLSAVSPFLLRTSTFAPHSLTNILAKSVAIE